MILEQSFLSDDARCTSALFLGHVVSLCLSFSSDEHHLSHSCLGTGMRFGTQNKFLSLSCIFGSFGVLDRFLISVGVCWWEQYHDIATFGRDYLDLRNRFVRCVLVNTLQYHDTVDFVQDSETEDPQLVAEPGVKRELCWKFESRHTPD